MTFRTGATKGYTTHVVDGPQSRGKSPFSTLFMRFTWFIVPLVAGRVCYTLPSDNSNQITTFNSSSVMIARQKCIKTRAFRTFSSLNFRMFFVLVHSIEIGSFFQFLMKVVACYGREGHKTG